MLKTQISKLKHHQDNFKVDRQHFETVLKQYRIGRVKPIELVLKKYGDSFTHPLYTKIKSRLLDPEWIYLQQITQVRENALMAVRRGEFDIAKRLFTKARISLKANSLSCEGKLLHETFLEQAQSYLDYRRGNFEQVYIRMFNALAIDLVLEEKYDYEIMVIHRIQLLHNLVRTEACRGDFRRAMEIASTLLGYLSGTLEVLPFSGSWGRERLNDLSEEVLAATFSQITAEIALILAGKETQTTNNLLEIALHHLELSAINKNCLHQQSYQWFRLQQAIANQNFGAFLEKASCFLASGCADAPSLWYATVIDLVTLCKKFDFPESKLMIQEVVRDIPEWKFCSKKLLTLVDLK